MKVEDSGSREDTAGYLMESWQDDPSEGILASAMRAMFPFGYAQPYPDGSYLVPPEEPFRGIYQVEEGLAEIEHADYTNSASDEDEVRLMIFACLSSSSTCVPHHLFKS